MDRKIILSLLSLILIVLAIALLMPGGGKPDAKPKLPWDITVDESGLPSVFGLTLGKSTLKDAQKIFKEPGEISLFISPEGEYAIEAYFDRIYLSGLKGSFILALDADQASLKSIFKRGTRIQRLSTGNQQVTPSGEDISALAGSTFRHITYIPGANLDPDLIRKRFGEPDKLIKEVNSEVGATHWVYLNKGLDIAHNPEGKEVFQYVIPSEMERILAPLEEQAAKTSTN